MFTVYVSSYSIQDMDPPEYQNVRYKSQIHSSVTIIKIICVYTNMPDYNFLARFKPDKALSPALSLTTFITRLSVIIFINFVYTY